MHVLRPLCLALAGSVIYANAEVTPVAHYNLRGTPAIRDTAAPALWPNAATGGPELVRNGNPKIMSSAPLDRRSEYDGSVNFSAADQCYTTGKFLAHGDNFLVEVWANARRGNAPGYHAVLANGHGGVGFLIAQKEDEWVVLVGGVGVTSLGRVQADTWTHLALVQQQGRAVAYLNGSKVADLPHLGNAADNFALGATAPGKEPFDGWIAEARVATFAPGKLDLPADLLINTTQLRREKAKADADRAHLIAALTEHSPGLLVSSVLHESPVNDDWLIRPPTNAVTLQVATNGPGQSARLRLENGLISRTFVVGANLACTSLRRADKDLEFVRTIKPEVRIRVNGGDWIEVGGMTGAPEKAYLVEEWIAGLETRPAAFRFAGVSTSQPVAPYAWQPKFNAPPTEWPPKGLRVTFRFIPPPGAVAPLKDLLIEVHYEMYVGLPVVMKTFTVHNRSSDEILLDEFHGEVLAVLQDKQPLLHVESDYSFGAANFHESGSSFLHFARQPEPGHLPYYYGGGTTRWQVDPEYDSWATLNPAEDLFLSDPHHCLLVSRPSVGPAQVIKPGKDFHAFRTFEILNDSTEKERKFLAQRRFYRRLAPQVNEHLLAIHAPTHDTSTLKALMDQAAELGWEFIQIEHPVGIAYDDLSPKNIAWLKELADYGRTKGIGLTGYELMIASRSRGAAVDCIEPGTDRPGSLFGQSVCAASSWSDGYFRNLWQLVDTTGLSGVAPDGPYHGDPCASTNHLHHRGLADSQWSQWKTQTDYFREGQRRNLFMSAPDWYFLNGQTCTGMGYREATDNLDIVLQTVLYRQYIFDGTYHKTAGMGWVNLNTEVLRGGLEANLDRYERQLFQMLGSGAQVWLRGTRLYDSAKTKAMVNKWTRWFKRHREVLAGDIIHLRRPDGRSLDYFLHINPAGREKGMLLVFNPTPQTVEQEIPVPLYYTGLTDVATIRHQDTEPETLRLDRAFTVRLPVKVPAQGYSFWTIE